MSATTTSLIVFACVFGGAVLGMVLRTVLPAHHLTSETKDVVKLGMGLVGTMSALLLSLLVASAKSSYDTEKNKITQMAAKIAFLDRLLANYGPQTGDARELMRRSISRAIDRMWPQEKSQSAQLDPLKSSGEALYDVMGKLSPETEMQRSFKSQALVIAADLGQTRWLLFEQSGSSISKPFLIVIVFWLAAIFASFGLFAPSNATVVCTLLFCALAVSGAIFLVMELDHPFDGLIQIPSAPMRNTLAHLGQ